MKLDAPPQWTTITVALYPQVLVVFSDLVTGFADLELTESLQPVPELEVYGPRVGGEVR